MTYSRKVPL